MQNWLNNHPVIHGFICTVGFVTFFMVMGYYLLG